VIFLKVMIIGDSGAGKSTLAREISLLTGLSVLHLDRIWLASFSDEALRTGQIDFLAAHPEGWVIDGNYRGTMDLRLPAADVVIWLQISPVKALWRVILRSIQHRLFHNRSDIPEDFVEKFDKEWFEFLSFVWHAPKKNKQNLREILLKYEKLEQTVIIKTKKDKKKLLTDLSAQF
jgi:adenylate kinase family enzyme